MVLVSLLGPDYTNLTKYSSITPLEEDNSQEFKENPAKLQNSQEVNPSGKETWGQSRFITTDPARDGSNWYAYASNNPVNRYDPTGLADGPTSDMINYSSMFDGALGFGTSGSLEYSNDLNDFLPFKDETDWGFSSGGQLIQKNWSDGLFSFNQRTFNPRYNPDGPRLPGNIGITDDRSYFDPVSASLYQNFPDINLGINLELGMDSPSIGGGLQNLTHMLQGEIAPYLIRDSYMRPVGNFGAIYSGSIGTKNAFLRGGGVANLGTTQNSLGVFLRGATDFGSDGIFELSASTLLEGGAFHQYSNSPSNYFSPAFHAQASAKVALNTPTFFDYNTRVNTSFSLTSDWNTSNPGRNNTYWTVGLGLKKDMF